MQNSVSENLSNRNYSNSQRVHRQPAATKLFRSQKKSRPKLGSNEVGYFRRKRDYCSKKQFRPSSLIFCLEMEQIVLVPLSVYNSSNNPTTVTKQGLRKYKPEQKPTYQKNTIKKEIKQHLTTGATTL